jgi:hypothetical protein
MLSKLIATAAVITVAAVGTATAGTTPQGLKADGLRYQALAERYQQMRGMTPAGLTADGLRWQAIARAYLNRPAASFYTPQALRAEGLRWQALARASAPVAVTSASSGFDWTDAGIGAAGGLGVALMGVGLVSVTRRIRRTKLAL